MHKLTFSRIVKILLLLALCLCCGMVLYAALTTPPLFGNTRAIVHVFAHVACICL